ncbi:sensor histidine kinase [Magnetococcales bacterium HHB-1]
MEKRFWTIISITVTMTLIVATVAMILLYKAIFDQHHTRLIAKAKGEARLMESIARHELIMGRSYSHQTASNAVQHIFLEAHRHFTPGSDSEETYIVQRQEGKISFVLRHNRHGLSQPASIAYNAPFAEPFRRALNGESGLWQGQDQQGNDLLMAYEPVELLKLAILVKMDHHEIFLPFLHTVPVTLILIFFVILIGILFIDRLFKNVLHRTQDQITEAEAIIAASPVPLAIFRASDGLMLYANDVAKTLFFLVEDDLLVYGDAILHPPKENQESWLDQVRREGYLNGWEAKIQKHGTEEQQWMAISAQKTLFAGDEAYTVSLHDITTYRQKIKILKQKKQQLVARVRRRTTEWEASNRDLEAFTYAVSHDLRAPLHNIDGFSRIIKEDYGHTLDTQVNNYLSKVRRGVHRMRKRIDALLLFSRSTRGDMRGQRLDISTIAAHLATDIQKRYPEQKVDLKIEPNMVAQGDQRLMTTALTQLLDNAWKFTSKTAQPRIELRQKKNDAGHIFYLCDNGAGFDENYQDKLFIPFQRLHSDREFPGIGMGLAIVARIIHRHGGVIEGHGTPGEGATFSFSLSQEPLT